MLALDTPENKDLTWTHTWTGPRLMCLMADSSAQDATIPGTVFYALLFCSGNPMLHAINNCLVQTYVTSSACTATWLHPCTCQCDPLVQAAVVQVLPVMELSLWHMQ